MKVKIESCLTKTEAIDVMRNKFAIIAINFMNFSIWCRIKMKVFVGVLFLFTTSFSSANAQGDESSYYSRRYDSLDVNTIFRSSRLLNNYVDCLLDKKPCPPEGKDLKSKKLNGDWCQKVNGNWQRTRNSCHANALFGWRM